MNETTAALQMNDPFDFTGRRGSHRPRACPPPRKIVCRSIRVPWLLILCLITLVGSGPLRVVAQEATPVTSELAAPEVGDIVFETLGENLDPAVDPGEDFYRYATGGWQDRTEIPPDDGSYSVWYEVDDLTIAQLLDLLDRQLASGELAVGSDAWKAVQFYAQARDLETRNGLGMTPIENDLAQIDAVTTLEDFYRLLREGRLTTNIYGLHSLYVSPDLEDSSIYAAWLGGPWLGLPNRDYYWVDDEFNETTRDAYREMLASMFRYAGYEAVRAEEAATKVYELEKRLAEPTLSPEAWNDPANYYHPQPLSELVAAHPAFAWAAYLEIVGIEDLATVIVTEEAYLAAVEEIVADTDLETLKDYLRAQVLVNTYETLDETIDAIGFAFYGTALWGLEQQRPIDERALFSANSSLGFALGKLYVDEYFPPRAKAEMEAMIDQIKQVTRRRIEALTWMSPETKEAAIAKLDAMNVKVGYPEKWRTYERASIEESYAQSVLSSAVADQLWWFERIGQPVDRGEWFMLPQEVNAYYDASNNEIVLPAAVLQPPFFDPEADPATNYGAIGALIGHEITHAFDQSGSQFDAQGNLANWWTDEDHDEFEALTARVVAQYDGIEVLPGLQVDGELTIGENVADLGGLQIAFDALQATLAEQGSPGGIDGLTQDQRFFVAYANYWAEEAREEYLHWLIQSDVHAPAEVRAVQPARNMDEFFAAFDIEPGDPMYLPSEERIVVW